MKKICLKNKKWLYLFAMLAFLVYLLNANNLIAWISNGPYQIKSVNQNITKTHDSVYYGLEQVYLQNDLTERVFLSGWAFCETTEDNSDKYVAVILKSNTETLKIQGLKIFSPIYDYFLNNNVNVRGTMHGFNIIFSTVSIKNGIYDLYIYDKENSKNYGAMYTGIKFIKDENGFRKLKNKPIENFPEAETVTRVRFELDSATVKDKEMTFKGWGILNDADSGESKVYLEVSDKDGNSYVYQIAQSIRRDIQKTYKTDKYMLSGIKGTLDLSQIPDGTIELRFIVENGGYYRSKQVKLYNYKSQDNNNGLTFISEENAYGNSKPIENFPQAETVGEMRFELDTAMVQDRVMMLSGWGILYNADSSKSKIYLEVHDMNGSAYIYRINQNVRNDINEAFNTDKYLHSGINGNLDISQIPDGIIELRFIVDNGGYYRSSQVKQYEYNSKNNTLELINQ